MQLSKHFKLEEFEKSSTAIRHGIENKAGSGEIKNLTDLCYAVYTLLLPPFTPYCSLHFHPSAIHNCSSAQNSSNLT